MWGRRGVSLAGRKGAWGSVQERLAARGAHSRSLDRSWASPAAQMRNPWAAWAVKVLAGLHSLGQAPAALPRPPMHVWPTETRAAAAKHPATSPTLCQVHAAWCKPSGAGLGSCPVQTARCRARLGAHPRSPHPPPASASPPPPPPAAPQPPPQRQRRQRRRRAPPLPPPAAHAAGLRCLAPPAGGDGRLAGEGGRAGRAASRRTLMAARRALRTQRRCPRE